MPTHDRRQHWEERLRAALAETESTTLATLLADMHAADLAELFPELAADAQQRILATLSDEGAAALLDELAPQDRALLLDQLPLERASDILEEMPSDEAADLLRELPAHEADALLQRMQPKTAGDVADLLRYPEGTAGGLMVKEFVRVSPEQTVHDVLSLLRRHHADAEMIYYLYALDEEDRLLGVLTLRKLIVADPQTTIADIMAREFVSVPLELPQEDVAEVVRRHDLLAVPVLDGDGRMQGMVTVDDIGDVVQEEAADELLEMSGGEEDTEPPRTGFVARGWRSGLLALAGGFLAVPLIWHAVPAVAVWPQRAVVLPILLVLGITTGSQAAIAMDRACDNAVERRQTARVFLREAAAGAILAIIGGLLAGILTVFLPGRRPAPVLTVTLAMTLGLWVATLSGALGALVVRRGGGWLGAAAHTIVVVTALLLAIAAYLLLTRAMPGIR